MPSRALPPWTSTSPHESRFGDADPWDSLYVTYWGSRANGGRGSLELAPGGLWSVGCVSRSYHGLVGARGSPGACCLCLVFCLKTCLGDAFLLPRFSQSISKFICCKIPFETRFETTSETFEMGGIKSKRMISGRFRAVRRLSVCLSAFVGNFRNKIGHFVDPCGPTYRPLSEIFESGPNPCYRKGGLCSS